MSPGGILGCHPDDKLFDCCRGRWTSGPAVCGVVPPCARPAGGARPGSWQESPKRPPPSGDGARAEIKRPATPGRRACSAPGPPVGATRRSHAVRPAVRHPCSNLTAPAPRSHRADAVDFVHGGPETPQFKPAIQYPSPTASLPSSLSGLRRRPGRGPSQRRPRSRRCVCGSGAAAPLPL
jgi:hypothetical protein